MSVITKNNADFLLNLRIYCGDNQADRHTVMREAGKPMFKTIDDPNSVQAQFKGTRVQGLNDNGELVGLYNTNSGVFGFYEIGGAFATLPDPSPGLTSGFGANGVNNSGQIVGEYDLQAGGYHGFLYSGGTYTTIEDPNAAAFGATACNGINDLGQIVGSYLAGNGVEHGFRYSGGANGTYTHDRRSIGSSDLGARHQ